MIRILLIVMALCVTGASSYAIGSAPCSSILDVDQLTSEEKDKLRAEIEQFQAQRLLNGAAVCIQIDFMEQLPPVRQGFTEDGRKIIHRSVYDEWQTRHFSQPAVLLLFVKGPGRYVLHDLVLSRPVARHLPDLVRRYIRDEIIKKQPDSYEAVSAGVYALSQALNSEYKERLIETGRNLLNEKHYYRGYTYYPLYYFYFTSAHQKENNAGCSNLDYFVDGRLHELFLLGDQISLSKNKATLFDLYVGRRTGYLSNAHGNRVNTDGKDNIVLEVTLDGVESMYATGTYQLPNVTPLSEYIPTYIDFSGSPDFADAKELEEKGEGNYQGLSRKLNEISSNDFHFKEWKFVKYKSPLVFDDHTKHCLCSVALITGFKNKGGPYTTLEGLSTYGKSHFRGAQCTMCNHYASDLSVILGRKRGVPADKSSSALAKLFAEGSDYIDLRKFRDADKELFWRYINLGYPVYFCKSGHIETGYPRGEENIGHKEKYEDSFKNTSLSTYDAYTTYHTIGAGAETGMKHYDGFSFLSNPMTGVFLYLGHLKKP